MNKPIFKLFQLNTTEVKQNFDEQIELLPAILSFLKIQTLKNYVNRRGKSY